MSSFVVSVLQYTASVWSFGILKRLLIYVLPFNFNVVMLIGKGQRFFWWDFLVTIISSTIYIFHICNGNISIQHSFHAVGESYQEDHNIPFGVAAVK